MSRSCRRSAVRRAHGCSGFPEHTAWQHMLARCETPTHAKRARYSERGITVCERWHSFELFLEDMGFRPSPAHSLGRVDNELGYFAANCRWETPREQARNRSTTVWVHFNGERLPAITVAERCDVPASALYGRLRRNWCPLIAATKPVAQRAPSATSTPDPQPCVAPDAIDLACPAVPRESDPPCPQHSEAPR